MADFSSIGRSNRRRGNSFELRCRELMVDITGHPYWKRTVAGHVQVYGDLMAVDELGKILLHGANDLYVECKYRTALSSSKVLKLIHEVVDKSLRYGHEHWILLVGQPGNPVTVYVNGSFPYRKWMEGRIGGYINEPR